jgi:hypothetical protein
MKHLGKLGKLATKTVDIVTTAHPTNPNVKIFAKKLSDQRNLSLGNVLFDEQKLFAIENNDSQSIQDQSNYERPKLWHEILYYSTKYPQFLNNLEQNKAQNYIGQLNSWIGFDNDRHQDEQSGIFTFGYLLHLINIGKFYQYDKNGNLVKNALDTVDKLYNQFENQENVDLAEFVPNLQQIGKELKLIDQAKLNQNPIKLVPPTVHHFHYRINSADLLTTEGIKKIKNRLAELKILQECTGQQIVSEKIIADCNDKNQILIADNLLKDCGVKNIKTVPLIEDFLDSDKIKEMLNPSTDLSINKIMLAGSDSIQRITYLGAMLMKINIQQIIIDENKKRKKDNKESVAFFEGAGSTINRNGGVYGGMLESRLNTIHLQNIAYQRTIQGKEAEMFFTDKSYQKEILKAIESSSGCSEEDLSKAQPIIEKIFNQVSSVQIKTQQGPGFTDNYNRELITNLLKGLGYNGSRAKTPKEPLELSIKNERAITQSTINQITGLHPELFHWDLFTEDLQNEVINNLDNPIIIDFINHYGALKITANLNPEKWLAEEVQDKPTKQISFSKYHKVGCASMDAFLDKVKKALETREDLAGKYLICKDIHEQIGASYNYEEDCPRNIYQQFSKIREFRATPEKIINPANSQKLMRSGLYKYQGSGFSTIS